MGWNGENAEKLWATADTGETILKAQWTPDGDHIAYLATTHPSTAGPSSRSIKLRNLRSGTVSTITNADNLDDFVLLPGERLIFSREEPQKDSDELWELPLQGALLSPKGLPRRISNWGGSYLTGFSSASDGKKIAFLKTSVSLGTYIASFDRSKLTLDDVRLLTVGDAASIPMDWSLEGKEIVLTSRHNGHLGVSKQAVDSENAMTLVQGTKGAECLMPRVSPDGAWVVYLEAPEPSSDVGNMRVMRVPIDGGTPEFILNGNLYGGVRCGNSQANFCAYAERSSGANELRFFSFDPVRGNAREMVDISVEPTKKYNWALSPNGSYILVTIDNGQGHLSIIPTNGEPVRAIEIKGWPGLEYMDFSADSKGFLTTSTVNGLTSLLYIDLSGKVTPLWQPKAPSVGWAINSRDGKRLAVMGNSSLANVWTVTDF